MFAHEKTSTDKDCLSTHIEALLSALSNRPECYNVVKCMQKLLQDPCFDYIDPQDKAFIVDFTHAMKKRGYEFGDKIVPGICWGRNMIIYTKSKRCLARIYLRDESIALRLYLNQIDDHCAYIESSSELIKSVFTGPHGACHHCHNEKNGSCKFRKTYTIDGVTIEKCNGETFVFDQPDSIKLPEYLALIDEFIQPKRKKELS